MSGTRARADLSHPLARADFGHQHLNGRPLAALLVRNYRALLVGLSFVLILAQLPFLDVTPRLILAILAGGSVYVLVGPRVVAVLAVRLRWPTVQLVHAGFLLGAITLLLWWLHFVLELRYELLWILYLPGLLLVSFYAQRQRWYILLSLAAAVFTGYIQWHTLISSGSSSLAALGAMLAQFCALLIASGTIHYLAQVSAISSKGHLLRHRVIELLLQRLLTEMDDAGLWWAVREACIMATGACGGEVYLYDAPRRRLVRTEPPEGTAVRPSEVRLWPEVSIEAEEQPGTLAARAVRDGPQLPERISSGETELAVRIYAYRDADGWAGPTLGVVVVQIADPLASVPPSHPFFWLARATDVLNAHLLGGAPAMNRTTVAQHFLDDLLTQIWPVCTYASVGLPKLRPVAEAAEDEDRPRRRPDGTYPTLGRRLDQVLDQVLDSLCLKFGFEFATISLVDDQGKTIRTVKTKTLIPNVVDPESWKPVASHAIDGTDIQADVLRTGRIEVIKAWDPRLDRSIYDAHGHVAFTRVFLRVGTTAGSAGGFGTIEAGFRTAERTTGVPELLQRILVRYAQLDVAAAIRDAREYDREQRFVQALTRLHELDQALAENDDAPTVDERLQRFVRATSAVLEADFVLLYVAERPSPRDAASLPFQQPIFYDAAGSRGAGQALAQEYDSQRSALAEAPRSDATRNARLAEAPRPDSVVYHIARGSQSYYQPDAQADSRLITASARGYSLVERHTIASFAGVPLRADQLVFGVLCLNYDTPRDFGRDEQRLIHRVADYALDLLASAEIVRAQERRRFQDELHHAVKTNAGALLMRADEVQKALRSDPTAAETSLRQLCRIALEIRSNSQLLTTGLQADKSMGLWLQELFVEELLRTAGPQQFGAPTSRVVLGWRGLDDGFPDLPSNALIALQSIVRESVWNALQHSGATRIIVHAARVGNRFQLTIRDNGLGFDPSHKQGADHRGIHSMFETASGIGAKFSIDHRPNGGMRVRLVVALDDEAPSSFRSTEVA